jgi:2-oxoisovalerate dehydrogenase E1 component alpha subunit
MPGTVVDGADVIAVHQATAEAAARARAGEGPTLVEAMVERYLPHTSDDDDSRYRPPEDIEEARKRDPLKILGERLTVHGVLTEELDRRLRDDAKRAVNDATERVEQAPYPDTDGFFDDVYAGGAPSPQ